MSVQKVFGRFKRDPSKKTHSLKSIVRHYKDSWRSSTILLDPSTLNDEFEDLESKFIPELSPPLFNRTFHFGIRRTLSLGRKNKSLKENIFQHAPEVHENTGEYRSKQKPFEQVGTHFKRSKPRTGSILTISPDFQPRIDYVPLGDIDAFDKGYLNEVRQSLINLRRTHQLS